MQTWFFFSTYLQDKQMILRSFSKIKSNRITIVLQSIQKNSYFVLNAIVADILLSTRNNIIIYDIRSSIIPILYMYNTLIQRETRRAHN